MFDTSLDMVFDLVVLVEAVHLVEQLEEALLLLVGAPRRRRLPRLADRIDLVCAREVGIQDINYMGRIRTEL